MVSNEFLKIKQAAEASIIDVMSKKSEEARIIPLQIANWKSTIDEIMAERQRDEKIRCENNREIFMGSGLIKILEDFKESKLLDTKEVVIPDKIEWLNDNNDVIFRFNKVLYKEPGYMGSVHYVDGASRINWSHLYFQLTENNEVALNYYDRSRNRGDQEVSIIGMKNIGEALTDVLVKQKTGFVESVYVGGSHRYKQY